MCYNAVIENGLVLEIVPDMYKNNMMCTAAINNTPMALQYVPDNIITYELCYNSVKTYGRVLEYVPEKHKTYKLCLTAVKNSRLALDYVPDRFMTYELCILALRKYGISTLSKLPEKYKSIIKQKIKDGDIQTNRRVQYV